MQNLSNTEPFLYDICENVRQLMRILLPEVMKSGWLVGWLVAVVMFINNNIPLVVLGAVLGIFIFRKEPFSI